MVYKAFIRPCLEYAHLTWMGAAPSHLEHLDAVQRAAAHLIGEDGPELDSLDHRRRVGALTYLYKLRCWTSWTPPVRLQDLVPPPLPQPPIGETRAMEPASEKSPTQSGRVASQKYPLARMRPGHVALVKASKASGAKGRRAR